MSYKRTNPFDADGMHFAVTTLHPSHANLLHRADCRGMVDGVKWCHVSFVRFLLHMEWSLKFDYIPNLFVSFQAVFVFTGIRVKNIFLEGKTTRFTTSQIYLIKYITCFGEIHCPSSGLSQHCIHTIGICHASYVGCLLTWSSTTLAAANRTSATNTTYLSRVYSIEILLMMDSGLVRNM